MKKAIMLLLFAPLGTGALAQHKEEAEKLVEEGIPYHQKGDQEGAILRFDKALALDKDNLYALVEKAYSLMALKKYQECITVSRQGIAAHPRDANIATLYVTSGNALDALNKTDQSIETYDEGIRAFPENYELYFNKAISLASVKKYEDALINLQTAAMLNPKHAGTHNAIARIAYMQHKKIPALLAYGRFFTLEQQSNRAKDNLESLQTIMKGNAKQTGKNNISISIDAASLTDTAAGGKRKENSFTSTDMLLSLSAALDYDEKNSSKTPVEQFIRKFDLVCASLGETRKENFGFFWSYYAPYFIEMHDKHLVKPFAYIAFAASEAPEVTQWLKDHEAETDRFMAWSKAFEWRMRK